MRLAFRERSYREIPRVTVETLRRIAAIHGLLAWSAAALLLIAAALLARRRPPSTKTTNANTIVISALATALLAISGGLGILLHAPYLSRLRQRIFLSDPALGWLFERKTHLAFGALGLAFCGLASLLALAFVGRRLALRTDVGPTSSLPIALWRAAFAAYATSAAFSVAACILSSLVGRFSF